MLTKQSLWLAADVEVRFGMTSDSHGSTLGWKKEMMIDGQMGMETGCCSDTEVGNNANIKRKKVIIERKNGLLLFCFSESPVMEKVKKDQNKR